MSCSTGVSGSVTVALTSISVPASTRSAPATTDTIVGGWLLTTGGGVGADGESLHAASRLTPQTTNSRNPVRAGTTAGL